MKGGNTVRANLNKLLWVVLGVTMKEMMMSQRTMILLSWLTTQMRCASKFAWIRMNGSRIAVVQGT